MPMPGTKLRILQLNCQGSKAVMANLGVLMKEDNYSLALLQEPYTAFGRVCGLPAHMVVYPDSQVKAAVVINDSSLVGLVVKSDNRGVCVSVEGTFGRLVVASIYCQFGEPLEPYIEYMDSALLLVSNVPVILGLDANAVSTMWFSKMPERQFRHQNYYRGLQLSEWCTASGLHVLNAPSSYYTFDGPRGKSDIDVTLANSHAIRKFDVRWKVLGG